MQGGGILFDTNITVSLEDYRIDEDAAAQGYDLMVAINLKQWREYGTKTIAISFPKAGEAPKATVENPRKGNAAVIGIGSAVVVKDVCIQAVTGKDRGNPCQTTWERLTL